jgi:DNA-binding transcriptional LysR family regulator
MHLEALQLFCRAAREGRFARAGRACGYAPAAVSMMIARLEKELGARLFERGRRPCVPTPAGERLRAGLEPILARYAKLRERLRASAAQISGVIRVAAIYSLGIHALGRPVRRFRRRHPRVRVRLAYLRPDDVRAAVLAGEADLGMTSYPSSSRRLAVAPLRLERMVFVCSPLHRLALRKGIEAADLAGEDFVAFERNWPIRRAIDRALLRRGVRLEIVQEFDNLEHIKQAVERNAGVSILPEPALGVELERRSLVALPLAIAELVRPVGLIYLRRKQLPPALTRFIEVLKEDALASPEEAERQELHRVLRTVPPPRKGEE